MDSIKELATVFCAVCLLSGGLGLLVGGKLRKSAGYILSLILLLSVVGALAKTDLDFNIEQKTEAALSEGYEEAMSEYQAEYIAGTLLREAQISYEKVSASANKNPDGGIIINEIIIKGASNTAEAARIIKQSGLCDRVKTE